MKRKTALSFDRMEERRLLSGLSATLTTNQSVYQPGQPIDFLLTETIVSDQPVEVTITAPNAYIFDVTQNGSTIWSSDNPYEAQPQVIETELLQPGQSYTETNAWNGTIGNGSNGSAQAQPTTIASSQTVVGNFAVSIDGASANFTIQSPLTYQLTADQTQASSGQITFSYTTTNVSTAPVTVTVPPAEFQIVNPSGIVEDTNPNAGSQPTQTETLQPGQSITQTAVWNDSAYTSTIQNKPWLDDLTLSVPSAPSGLNVRFTLELPGQTIVEPPIGSSPPGGNSGSSSVPTSPITSVITTAPITSNAPSTTTTPTYKLGQSIRISTTLENTSASTIDLKGRSNRLEITILEANRVVFRETKIAHSTKPKTLDAGRRLQTSFVWNGKPNQPGVRKLLPGTYTIDVEEDGFSAESSIQLVSRSSK
jgi:hypothetical protein